MVIETMPRARKILEKLDSAEECEPTGLLKGGLVEWEYRKRKVMVEPVPAVGEY